MPLGVSRLAPTEVVDAEEILILFALTLRNMDIWYTYIAIILQLGLRAGNSTSRSHDLNVISLAAGGRRHFFTRSTTLSLTLCYDLCRWRSLIILHSVLLLGLRLCTPSVRHRVADVRPQHVLPATPSRRRDGHAFVQERVCAVLHPGPVELKALPEAQHRARNRPE